MTTYSGNLRKMWTRLAEPVVQYQLPIGESLVDMNALINQSVSFRFAGQIHCTHCGVITKKSYQQGHCYPCMMRLAECDLCIMKPERCHYEAGTCRDNDWAHAHCMVGHTVYLANSSGLKVGITRNTQVPTRWIDQGAAQAIALFHVANRKQSGDMEVAIKAFVSDRTDWRRMLKQAPETLDMIAARDALLLQAKTEVDAVVAQYGEEKIQFISQPDQYTIHYPVEKYPEKVKSLSFDKTPEISGILHGIKGQYLILDCGVLNIRKHTGYGVELSL